MGIEEVLNDYRNGDEDKRLSLFLFYRDLRDEFSCIDRDMAANQTPMKKISPPSRQGRKENLKF